jgi:hypothetical protein
MTVSIITLCEYAEYRRAGADIFSCRNDEVKLFFFKFLLYSISVNNKWNKNKEECLLLNKVNVLVPENGKIFIFKVLLHFFKFILLTIIIVVRNRSKLYVYVNSS